MKKTLFARFSGYILQLSLVLSLLVPVTAKAGSFTDYFEQQIVGHMLCGATYTPPTTYYVALFTASPGESTAGTEATGGSYARVAVTFTRSASTASNAAIAEFPVSTADRGNIIAIGYYDASTGGNLCAFHVLMTAKTYNTGQTLRFAIGALTSSVD